jgi:hypothetical protein
MCDSFDEIQPSKGRPGPAEGRDDHLAGDTGTPVVSKRSEAGPGILGVTVGRGT